MLYERKKHLHGWDVIAVIDIITQDLDAYIYICTYEADKCMCMWSEY